MRDVMKRAEASKTRTVENVLSHVRTLISPMMLAHKKNPLSMPSALSRVIHATASQLNAPTVKKQKPGRVKPKAMRNDPSTLVSVPVHLIRE